MRKLCVSLPGVMLFVLSHAGVQAQTVMPDAGVLQREAERALQAPATPIRPGTRPLKPMPQDEQAVRVQVRAIVMDGASLIPEAELQALMADVIGQALTLQELEHVAQRVAEYYRSRGWYARVYLPQQDVTDGTVRVQVLEGRFGGSTVQSIGTMAGTTTEAAPGTAPNPAGRANAERVQGVVTHRLQDGQPLSAADLERGLLLANDLAGIRAIGVLQPGQQTGETALALQVQDTAFVTGDAALSNYGLRATGRVQAQGGIALNNLSGGGDQLALRLLAARDIHSAMARYSLPLGMDGLRLAAHASALGYKLGDVYKPLDAKGKALTGGLTLSYPLLRQTEHNLSISASYEYRRYDDDMLGQALRRPRVHAATLGLSGDSRDSLGSGGINWGNAQLVLGQVDLDGHAMDKLLDQLSAGTAGSYAKLAWTLGRLQRINAGWQAQAVLSGQLANGNLASSERMSLGGPTQVRAYPLNEASGDQGLLLKLELQRELGRGWQAVAFYDAGRVRQHKHAWSGWNAASNQPNSYTLQGAGLGLNWRQSGWQLQASVAAPIGRNRGQDASGRNSDGSRVHSVRGWLSLARLF